MSGQWYYQVMGETFGPLTFDELWNAVERGEISEETLVMEEANGKWEPAWCIKGLFDDTQFDTEETSSPTNEVSPEELERIAAEALGGTDDPPTASERTPSAKSNETANNSTGKNLRYCPDCKQLISKQANACIHCGRSFNSSKSSGSPGPHVFAIVCSVLLTIGCCLPWIQLGALFMNRGISGPDGAIVLVLAVVAIGAGLYNLFGKGIKLHWPYFLAGFVALVIGIFDLVDVHDRATHLAKNLEKVSEMLLGSHAEVDWWQLVGSGLYVVLLSAVALIFAGIVAKLND